MSDEQRTPDETNRLKKLDNYVFVGLPKAGKTTYFTVMAKTLQNIASKSDKRYDGGVILSDPIFPLSDIVRMLRNFCGRGAAMKFRFMNDETREFVHAGWAALTAREPDWPDKTETYESGYEFTLEQQISVWGLKLPWMVRRRASFLYHDYPGEAYAAAFGTALNDAFSDMADKMRQQIRMARGVFLLLDADKLFNGQDREALEATTEHLFRFIHENNPKAKLAILFNKLELFEDMAVECDFAEMFRDRYTSAYEWLPPKYRFFNVYSIGKLDVDENGNKVPVRPIAPCGVIEPVQWMLGFKGRFVE